jgi:hypothetical protein
MPANQRTCQTCGAATLPLLQVIVQTYVTRRISVKPAVPRDPKTWRSSSLIPPPRTRNGTRARATLDEPERAARTPPRARASRLALFARCARHEY